MFRTDNGGEFFEDEFEDFCLKWGIEKQKTTSYTPQQNGVTKRVNRTLMKKGKKHAKQCCDRTRILGKGGGDNILLGKSITHINIG